MSKLFISYAHADSATVNEICKGLQETGHEIWIDTHGIQGGTLWGSEIAKAIIGCDVFLLFVSPRSVSSDYVRREVDIAFDEKRKILPVMLENVDIPVELDYQLAGIQRVYYQASDGRARLLAALGTPAVLRSLKDTGKLKNPHSSLPVLEPIERILILSNREKELKRGVDYLRNHRLLLITGMPGIGKSTFARALLEFMPAGSPPPFWYNFERQRSTGNSLSVLLDYISSYLDVCLDADVRREVMTFHGQPSVQNVDTLISFLNQDPAIWLVFDNLETVLSLDTNEFLDENLELLFESLKTSTHNAKIIITTPFVPMMQSGESYLEDGTTDLALEGLDDDFSIAFLRAYGLQNLSESQLKPIVREINGHPFILNHIARYIQAIGISAAMENFQGGLEEVSERFGDTLRQRLSTQEFNALRSVIILNREIPLSGLCQVAQVKPGVIGRLRGKGLLQTNDTGKFWLHNIVRSSLRPTESDQLRQAHVRAMNYYRNLTLPFAPQGIEDYANVLEWHHHAVEAGDAINAYSALYSTTLKDQLMKWNEYGLVVRLCERTLSAAYQVESNITQIEPNLSNHERIEIYHTLGVACFLLGDLTRSIAHLDSAMRLLPSRGDEELRVKLLIDLSESHNSNGNSKLAMELCQQIATLLVDIRDGALEAKFLQLRGIIHRDQGSLEEATQDFEQALKLYKEGGDQIHVASALVELGISYYYQNQIEKAIQNYRDAVVLYEEVKYDRGIMVARYNIGDILLQASEFELAAKELQIVLEIGQKGEFGNLTLGAGLGLAEAKIALSHLVEAREILDSLKPLLLRAQSDCFLGQELALLANIQLKDRSFVQSHSLFLRAFQYLQASGCQYEYARAHLAFAALLKAEGQNEKAIQSLMMAKRIFEKLKNQLGFKAVEEALAALTD